MKDNVVTKSSSSTAKIKKEGLLLWNGYQVADHIIQFNGLHYNENFNLVNYKNEEIEDIGKLIRNTKCFIDHKCLKVLAKENLADYLNDKIEDMYKKAQNEFDKKLFIYKESKENLVRKALQFIIKNPENLDLAEIALKNFIIQAKCNAKGLMVHNPIMPILVGNEELAKTGFARWFTSIFGDMCSEFGMDTIVNLERYGYRLAKKRIIIVEEMAGAAKSDQAKWKNIQTMKNFEIAVMREKFDKKYTRKAVFIGTSNRFSWQDMRDTTSNRRIIDVPCDTQITLNDFVELKKIEVWDMWQSVKCPETQEENNAWNSIVKEYIRTEQQKTKLKSFTEEFISEFGLTHGDDNNKDDWISLKSIEKAMVYHSEKMNKKRDFSDLKTLSLLLVKKHLFSRKIKNTGAHICIDKKVFFSKIEEYYGLNVATWFSK